ncbi:MAG: hypothetical protein ACRCZF_09620 [Gemmataceae bacterium]
MASPPSNDLTRQQLDELDSLLQRMLGQQNSQTPAVPAAVPISTPTTEAGWRVENGHGAPAVPHILPELDATPWTRARALLPEFQPEPPPAPAPMPVPVTPATPFQPLAELPKPIPVMESPKPVLVLDAFANVPLSGMPSPAKTGSIEEIPLVPMTAANENTVPETAPAEAHVPIWHYPLYLINGILEVGYELSSGGLLTSIPAKNILGVVGMLLMLGSTIWAARGYGYIHIPGAR